MIRSIRRHTLPLWSLTAVLSAAIVFFVLSNSKPAFAQGPQTTARSTQSDATAHTADGPWWKHAVIYEIYPRSFQDSNGDGTGDLNGITDRLGYLESLGVDAIWIAPCYPSPQADFGYDISDYEAIDPQYGTMADFDNLVSQAKKHHIRIIMDMVMNHTSNQHPWFKESESSRNNPKRDWYIWRSPKGYTKAGKPIPPNNWLSDFGGSAWQWDSKTKQFYYHAFLAQQPDLNWRNPAVEKAMFDVIRFWLDKGVAGFRLDAIPNLFEDPQLRNEPYTGKINAMGDREVTDIYTNNLPEVHVVMRKLRQVVASYPGDRVLIGETYLPSIQDLNKWYGGAAHNELQLPMDMQVGFINKMDAPLFRTRIEQAETQIDGNRPLFVFDNHDNPRSWDRYGDGVHNPSIARVIASILFTSNATAMMYNGQEIGMVTTPPKTKADVRDPAGLRGWPKYKGRDGERTPMQWSDEKNAGFSTADKTWLPIPPSYQDVNVKTEESQPGSLLRWYKDLISLRANDPTMRDGEQVMINKDNASVLAFIRKGVDGHDPIVVALNFSASPQTISLDAASAGITGTHVTTVLTDQPSLERTSTITNITLPPFASWIGRVD